MDDLRSLIKVMRVGEKRMLKHMLSRNTNSEENQRWKLFRYIDKDGSVSEDELRAKFVKTSNSAFSHLKSRLKDDILSVLLVKESPKRIAQANRAAQFECMKKLAQAYVLIFRGAKQEGASILKSAKELAIKYELAAELVSINHLTREALYSFTDAKSLNKVNTSLRNDLQLWNDILRSEELSFYITLPQLKDEMAKTEDEEYEARIINELKELYLKSNTARIGFWYYMADVENCVAEERFGDAIDLGLKFLELVENNPSVYSKNNIAGVNQTIGFAYLNYRNYVDASMHLARSEKLFPNAGFNRLQCLQLLVHAETALGSYAQAMAYVEKAMAHPRIGSREILVPRWLYNKSCIEFLSGDIDSSFKTLNKDGYLLKQQDEWNVQFRLLEMLQLVEMKDEEWLEFKIDATRKFLTRYKQLDTPRVRAAVDIIGNLLRKDLDFRLLSDKNKALLNHCLEEDPGYKWNPAGAELVRFDLWMKKKLPAQEVE